MALIYPPPIYSVRSVLSHLLQQDQTNGNALFSLILSANKFAIILILNSSFNRDLSCSVKFFQNATKSS